MKIFSTELKSIISRVYDSIDKIKDSDQDKRIDILERVLHESVETDNQERKDTKR
jgi:hypothetical protein